jgi:transcriptional regulator with XRE-family HTH domain
MSDNEKKEVNWSEKLKLILKTLDMNQNLLAKKAGISQSNISAIINGENSNPSWKLLSVLCKLGISADWLLKDEGDILGGNAMQIAAAIPLYDIRASAGKGVIADFLTHPSVKQWLDIRRDIVERYGDKVVAAVQIYGDSMMPTYHDGDYAVFAQGLIDGDGVYLLCMGENVYIKRLQFFPERNQLVIKSDNPLYEPHIIDLLSYETYISIVGRVVYTIHAT